EEKTERLHGAGVEVAVGMQAAHARRAAQPLELAGVVLDVDRVALVAALGEPVGQRDRMALGAPEPERSGDEHGPHACSLETRRPESAPRRLVAAYAAPRTAAPTARRSTGGAPARNCAATPQASAADSAARTKVLARPPQSCSSAKRVPVRRAMRRSVRARSR